MRYEPIYTVKDVMELCKCGRTKAYGIIQEVNEDMLKENKNYIITRGRVNTSRLLNKLGISKEDFRDACI